MFFLGGPRNKMGGPRPTQAPPWLRPCVCLLIHASPARATNLRQVSPPTHRRRPTDGRDNHGNPLVVKPGTEGMYARTRTQNLARKIMDTGPKLILLDDYHFNPKHNNV